MESKQNGENVPQNNTYLEYCAMETLGGKIQFMIWSGSRLPWALFHHLLLLLDFYGSCIRFWFRKEKSENAVDPFEIALHCPLSWIFHVPGANK
jgi:hypothetical protein